VALSEFGGADMSELILLGRAGAAKSFGAFRRHFALKACVLLVALLLLPMALSTTAASQALERHYTFNIGPSTMADGIKGIESATGISLVYAPDQIEGLRTNGVSGNLTIEEALGGLVEGTTLVIRTAGNDTYVVALARHSAELSDHSPADNPSNTQQARADALRAKLLPPETVVVTGTQIIRDGYESPTPSTVLSIDEIERDAPTDVANFINKIPGFANSQLARASSTFVSDANGGVSNLNLRSLGAERTLVLLDGMRIVPSSISGFNNQGGSVDVDLLPDQLISRIDVVTGGASAAYGSDALAGVVNFVLDKTFTGLKGTAEGGVTSYGDDYQYLANLTGGTAFYGDRGHILVSGSISHINGIMHGNSRSWLRQGYDQIPNPNYTATNGQPFYIITKQVGSGLFTPGGLIDTGPLRGTDFGPGGNPRAFNYGTLSSGGANMIGGDWQETVGALTDSSESDIASLDDRVSRQNIFTHASFDLNDQLQVFVQVMYSNTDSFGFCCSSSESATINSGNPFIPAPVQAEMTALGLPSIHLNVWNAALGAVGADDTHRLGQFGVGAKGKFDAMGTSWSWDANASRSISWTGATAVNDPISANFQQAVDVVINPATGAPVCASTLINSANGCIPYNPMGTGVNSADALTYAVGGTGHLSQTLGQNDFAATLRGAPLTISAGSVSVATGFEYRTLGVSGTATATDQANGFFVGNFHPTIGSYNVAEGFIETVIPLARDVSWAKTLDLNLAIRETGYSTSGNVTTWKIGATYDTPFDGVRIRATRSRDIRAPNLGELFSGGQSGEGNVLDPFHNNTTTPNILTIKIGNNALRPETADTTGAGLIYQPSWLSGFSASVDYFQVDITGEIASSVAQDEVNACYQGNIAYCNLIQRDSSGNIHIVYAQPSNTAYAKTSGFDIETTYRKSLSDLARAWDGAFFLRLLAHNTMVLTTVSPTGFVTPGAGDNDANGAPHWTANLSLGYETGDYSVVWTGRGLSSGVRSRLLTQCAEECPSFVAPYYTTNNNQLPGDFYMDLSLSYRLKVPDFDTADVFLTVENLSNNNPNFAVLSLSPGIYDTLGRLFRTGIRFKM
jgi:iron complex outermembrane receptor protein